MDLVHLVAHIVAADVGALTVVHAFFHVLVMDFHTEADAAAGAAELVVRTL